jgi:hypothetical protein
VQIGKWKKENGSGKSYFTAETEEDKHFLPKPGTNLTAGPVRNSFVSHGAKARSLQRDDKEPCPFTTCHLPFADLWRAVGRITDDGGRKVQKTEDSGRTKDRMTEDGVTGDGKSERQKAEGGQG